MPLFNPLTGFVKPIRLSLPKACIAIACGTLMPLQMAAASEPEPSMETLELAELEPAEIQLTDKEAAAWRAQASKAEGTAAPLGASKPEQDRRGDGATTGPAKR